MKKVGDLLNPYRSSNVCIRIAILFVLVSSVYVQAYAQTTTNLTYTGSPQTWTVPGGVSSVTVVAYGAGGSEGSVGFDRSRGGKITATLAVTAGQVMHIYIGGKGVGKTGGYNGGGTAELTYTGGGGGGATDIRINGTGLGNRVLVDGGGLTGGNGIDYNAQGTGGKGGTQSAGGAAGTGNDLNGFPGVLGTGGAGRSLTGSGGGGYYGGGSGGRYYEPAGRSLGAGGGGGSSYASATLCTNVLHGKALAYADGAMSIAYLCTGTVTPTVSVSANPGTAITTGTSVTFSATPTEGGVAPAFKWYKNNLEISGQLSATYVADGLADQDVIYCELESKAPCASPALVTSNSLTMDVSSLAVTTAASPLTICAGNSAALSVTATGGTAPYSFTWIAPASAVITGSANGTAATGTINTGASGVQTFTVLVSDAGQPSPVTSSATVSVSVVGINITKQPASASAVCAGTPVTVPVSASGAISAWQWYKGTTPVDGQTTATLSLTNPAITDSGEYRLVITGDCNSVTTTALTLTVGESVAVTAEPAAQSVVCAGASVFVPVSTTGAGSTIQWYKGTTPVISQTAATLSLQNVTTDEAGIYRLVVSGGCNSVTSAAFSLSVNTAPVISVNPSSTLITGGSSVLLTASGGESYIWSTGASLTAISVSPVTTSEYTVSAMGANSCVGHASTIVSVTCSALAPAKAISTTVATSLGAGNCAVVAEAQGTGSSFTFVGPEGYVYSSVYRRAGTYTVKAGNITKPGIYTFTASASNTCGQVSSDSITYIVTGSACP